MNMAIVSKNLHHHLHDLNIPPRKLLSDSNYIFSFDDDKHNNMSDSLESDLFGMYEFNILRCSQMSFDDDKLNTNMSDSLKFKESDLYSTDEFRMYEFKIRRCNRSRSHDWTECPFAHPGEKARRRDLHTHSYSASICPDFRRTGSCPRGDSCESAHGVFEMWLHPTRYRTQACKDGKHCTRKVCFFAHSPSQLRSISHISDGGSIEGQTQNLTKSHCCMYCSNYSPRSTLTAISPPMSPPSPATMPSLWVDVLSSPTPSRRTPMYLKTMSEYPFDVSPCANYKGLVVNERISTNGSGDPDLGWVEDLLL